MHGHLAQQTQQHHAAADGDRLAILEKPSGERYRTYLARIYRFEAPIERACIAAEDVPGGLLRTHLKSARLRTDLEALGFDEDTLPPLAPPRFAGAPEALAWMWVLHRNTLLHGLVYRYLRAKLPEPLEAAGSYLCAFEGRAGALMHELSASLERVARRASIAERISTAAKDAFRAQRQWYGSELPTTTIRRAA